MNVPQKKRARKSEVIQVALPLVAVVVHRAAVAVHHLVANQAKDLVRKGHQGRRVDRTLVERTDQEVGND